MVHLRRAKDLIDREYASPLGLDDLARSAGCSRYHFVRSFRAAHGETPGHAPDRAVLRSANLTVTEICVLVRFASRFTAVVGMSPSQYRIAHPAPAPIPGCFLMMWTKPAISEKAPGGDAD